jgi:hypothetical protein
MKTLNNSSIKIYLILFFLNIFLLMSCSNLRYSIEDIEINKNGFRITLQYSYDYKRKIYLPLEIAIYAADYSENFTYYQENFNTQNDEEKKQIIVQTLPLTEEPFADNKYYTNKIYHFEMYIGGGNAVECRFKIEKDSSSSVEEVIFKDDMSEYEIKILYSEFIRPH